MSRILHCIISYQNVVGESFVQNYDVTFLPTIESNTDDYVNGYFYISFQATNDIFDPKQEVKEVAAPFSPRLPHGRAAVCGDIPIM